MTKTLNLDDNEKFKNSYFSLITYHLSFIWMYDIFILVQEQNSAA